jgi:2-oxoglutarate dehydrogenase E2 component (dihydrolipoamide succinyltransferase)
MTKKTEEQVESGKESNSEKFINIYVPQLGESIKQAIVLKILKHENDKVKQDDTLCELETEKITLDVPISSDGVLSKLLISEKSTVSVGDLIAIVEIVDKNNEITHTNQEKKKQEEEASVEVTATEQEAEQEKEEPEEETRLVQKTPLSSFRKAASLHLKEAQNISASLTTFNEINMSSLVDLKERYKDSFQKKYNVKLGFMSFFIKAVIEALKRVPSLNAYINEVDEVVSHNYYDIGIAVSSVLGLVVPVIKDCDLLEIFEIECEIFKLADKARNKTVFLEDLKGGTFTLTNGGIYGSLLSTPILNFPQSGILGMHKIEDRPIVQNKKIVIAPMMYVALSYDHRLVDGKEAITFLTIVKDFIECPARFFLDV